MSDLVNCPDCGKPVNSIFDHVDQDCTAYGPSHIYDAVSSILKGYAGVIIYDNGCLRPLNDDQFKHYYAKFGGYGNKISNLGDGHFYKVLETNVDNLIMCEIYSGPVTGHCLVFHQDKER